MAEFVYLNGSLVALEDAKIQVTDYGFLYGFGLFETLRVYRGHAFRLDDHLGRMEQGASELTIAIDFATLKKAVLQLIEINRLQSGRVRIAISPGPGSPVPDPASCSSPTSLILAWPYSPPSKETYERGERVVISPLRRNSQSPLTGLKTANYLENLLARCQARTAGADDAVFMNDQGFVAEASSSNLFLVKSGVLKTPDLESGILPGITRKLILELASQAEIRTFEGKLHQRELFEADEAFLTNSIVEVMPVTLVNGKPVGNGKPGQLTQRLATAYRELVDRETSG